MSQNFDSARILIQLRVHWTFIKTDYSFSKHLCRSEEEASSKVIKSASPTIPFDVEKKIVSICTQCHRLTNLEPGLVTKKTQQKIIEILEKHNIPADQGEAHGSYFNKLSRISHIQFPLCFECIPKILRAAQRDYQNLKDDSKSLKSFSQSLSKENEDEYQLTELLKEEERLQEELGLLRKEQNELDQDLLSVIEENQELHTLEQHFWNEFMHIQQEIQEVEQKNNCTLEQLNNEKQALDFLATSHILKDMFAISTEGQFGTINALRLGRLASVPVEWSEINAALGFSALLIDILASLMNHNWQEYKICFRGSFTKMEYLKDHSLYELYGTGDISLGKLFSGRRLDIALVALLGCQNELAQVVSTKESSFSLKHKIEKESIGGSAIKLQFSTDPIWTQAMKNFLLNLKILVGWVLKIVG